MRAEAKAGDCAIPTPHNTPIHHPHPDTGSTGIHAGARPLTHTTSIPQKPLTTSRRDK